jgi:hypothetical protein
MRGAEAALDQGTGTRAAWTSAAVAFYLASHPEEAIDLAAVPDDSIPSVQEIRERAVIADRAHKAIPPLGRIDPNQDRHDEWAARLGWAEATLNSVMTKGFRAALAAVRSGDRSGLEYAVRFLEADPWCFRSGYVKAQLIPLVAQFELDPAIRERLARTVLSVVDDPRPRREIRRYGILARSVATPALRQQLEQRLAAADRQVRFNAGQVLTRMELAEQPKHVRRDVE